jgi:hypothetical protein
MDQLKNFFAVCKKQHFWILTGLAALIGLIVFFISQSKLQDAYGKRVTEIKTAATGLQPLMGGEHPNNDWIEQIHKVSNDIRRQVYDSWSRLYQEQLAKVYLWPPVTPDFAQTFSKPMGTLTADDTQVQREHYQTYITNVALPDMAKLIDAEWLVKPGTVGGEGGPRGGPRIGGHHPAAGDSEASSIPHSVEWSEMDQQRLYDAYNWQLPPSELDVRYAQEELWVMKAIFGAIANANKEGEIVREIDLTLIGYDATNKFPLGEGENRVMRVNKQGAAAPGGQAGLLGAPNMPGQPGAGPAPLIEPKRPIRSKGEGGSGSGAPMFGAPQIGGSGAPMIGGRPPMLGVPPGVNSGGPSAEGGAPDPDAPLKDGRYVDAKGKPLTAADLAANPDEFHLMAFKIRLVANQATFSKVIEEFSNSVLPLEVREVRVNPAGGMREEQGGREERHGNVAAKPGAAIHNVTLEIDGVAYLINPPDAKTIGLTDAAATATGAGATPANGATPATTTGPAAAPSPAATVPAATPAAPATGSPAAPTSPPATTPAAAPATTPAPGPTAPATIPATGAPATGAPAVAPSATTPAATPPAATTPSTPPATTPASPAAPAGAPAVAPK